MPSLAGRSARRREVGPIQAGTPSRWVKLAGQFRFIIRCGKTLNVQAAPGSLFELEEMQDLLGREWNLARRHAAHVASGRALSLAPIHRALEHGFGSHPELIRLHLEGPALRGDMTCLPQALPFECDSLQLIVVRHVGDVLGTDNDFDSELARVLAPGGTLILFGLNPLSPWRLWWSRQARRGLTAPGCRIPARMRRILADKHLTTGQIEFLGGWWPAKGSRETLVDESSSGAMWQGAWSLRARKPRAGMHVIPLNTMRKRIAIGHGLAQSPSRRASQ
jgi:SAM-dependent methyltransferase